MQPPDESTQGMSLIRLVLMGPSFAITWHGANARSRIDVVLYGMIDAPVDLFRIF